MARTRAAGTEALFENPIVRKTSPEERARRLAALREAMSRAGLDALVVCGRDDIRYRGRVVYVTDVWQIAADSFAVVPMEGDPVFIGHPVTGLGRALPSGWASELRLSGYPGQEVATIVSELGLDQGDIGVVGLADALSVQHFREMEDNLPKAQLRDATQLFDEIRQVKSDEELSNLRETSAIFREIYAGLESSIRPGITELDLAAEAHRSARWHGCRSVTVSVASTPFGPASFGGTTKEIARDDLVMVWIEGPGPSGYWLELRRLYSFGPVPDDVRKFWELEVESVAAAVEALKAETPAHEFVSTFARGVERGGWAVNTNPDDQSHVYSLHGIGLDGIEGVWVPGRDRILRENEVVSIHPVIDFSSAEDVARFGPIGITDNVLVTSSGGVRLTYETDEFIQL